jgi:hypothetical protein
MGDGDDDPLWPIVVGMIFAFVVAVVVRWFR